MDLKVYVNNLFFILYSVVPDISMLSPLPTSGLLERMTGTSLCVVHYNPGFWLLVYIYIYMASCFSFFSALGHTRYMCVTVKPYHP